MGMHGCALRLGGKKDEKKQRPLQGSNLRPLGSKPNALPTELNGPVDNLKESRGYKHRLFFPPKIFWPKNLIKMHEKGSVSLSFTFSLIERKTPPLLRSHRPSSCTGRCMWVKNYLYWRLMNECAQLFGLSHVLSWTCSENNNSNAKTEEMLLEFNAGRILMTIKDLFLTNMEFLNLIIDRYHFW